MNDWIKNIFDSSNKNEDSFWLIKSNASIKSFIESFEYKSAIEDQIIIVNQLIKILSYKKSIINICIINKFNEIKTHYENSLITQEKSNKLLTIYMKKDKINFVDWLIKEYFLYKNEKITKGILNLLSLVINIVGVQKSNIQFIYQKITDYFFYSGKKYFYDEDKININNDLTNLTRYLNLLLLMYGNNDKIIKPYNFYYFGNDGYLKMEPPLKQPNSLHLKGGITLFLCFNCLYNPKFINQKYSIIFSIEFNKEIYFSLLIDNEMNLVLSMTNENLNMINDYDIENKIILTNIESNKWYNIIISLNSKKYKKFLINLIINSKEFDTLEIENNNPIEKIENIIMFKNFVGLFTSFLLYNTIIDIKNNNNYFKDFQYGFYKISHINKYFNNYLNFSELQNIIILIIPFQIKSDNIYNFANFIYGNLIDDLIVLKDNINFKFIQNNNNDVFNEELYLSGSNINLRLNKNILILGGIDNLLPLFEILLFINKKIFDTKNFIYLNILQKNIICLLQTIEVIINKNKKSKIKNIINCKFFKIFSLFLEKINVTNDIEATMFNEKFIAILKNIGNLLINSNFINKQKLSKIFFNQILLNINIIKKFNISQQIKINKYIYQCLLNNNIILIDYNNLIYLIKYCENIYRINYCCKEHFLFIKEITEKETKMNYNKMLVNLLDINTKLLSIVIKNNIDAYIDVLNLLIGKSSPCFIELSLKNIFNENLNIKNKDNIHLKKILIHLLKNNFLYILLYLLSIYIYPKIIKEIIELLSIISYLSDIFGINLTNFFNNQNIINYISISIYPIQLKIKNDYISKLNNNLDNEYKFNHFFSSNILPIIANEDESFNYSLSNIKKCYTYDRFEIKNIELDNNTRKSIKLNNYKQKYERKRVISNTIKFHKKDDLKINKSLSNNKLKKKKKEFDLSFEYENKKLITNNERQSYKGYNDKIINFNNNNKLIFEETNNNIILLNKLEYDRKFIFKRLILDSLINWLKINPNKYIFEIIIKYIKNINYEYINIDIFIDSFNQILIESIKNENNNLNNLIDDKIFKWFFELIFQFYLLKNKFYNFCVIPFEENKFDLINNIIINGKKILINILLYYVNNNKFNYLITEIKYLMLFSKEIKKKSQNNIEIFNILNEFYRKILYDLLNICKHILFFLIKNNEDSDSESNSGFYIDDERENIFIFIINICYEFVFFNNIENNYININKFIKSKNNTIFNNILLSDINFIQNFEENNNNNINIYQNINNIEQNDFSIQKYLADFSIIERILLIVKPFIGLNNYIFYEDDKYLNENILNIKKSNTYFSILNILCRDNFVYSEFSMNMISFVYIISNIYIFSLNLGKNKNEIKYILENYKSFIIFLILSSSNLHDFEEDKEIENIINNIQNKISIVINYYIYYIYDRFKNDEEIIEKFLIEIFKLMIRIMNLINIQNKKKNSIFSKSPEKIKETRSINKCVVHSIFLNESMIKIFTKEYVSSLIKTKFKEFNNTNYFIELCSNIFMNFKMRYELKNIFNIDTLVEKYLDKNNNFEIFIDFCHNNYKLEKIKEKINEKIKRLTHNIIDNNNNYLEKIYIKKLNYKKQYKSIKKSIFGLNGFWRNKKIFDINDNNGETIKYKLTNHHSSTFFKFVLSPIFDLDNYLSQYQFINKNTIFKQNKNSNNSNNINYFRKSIINLDIKKIFIDINKKEQQKNNINDNNIHNYLIEEIRNNNFPDLNDNINRISNNNMFEFIANNPSKKSYLISNSYSCCYIKTDTHIKGYLSMTDKKMKFVMDIYNNNIQKFDEDEYDKDRGCCYGSIIKYKNNSKFVSFQIKYSLIKFIFLRKYYYKDSSLEIFTRENKSYYIYFHNPKIRKYIIDIILIHFHSKQEIKINNDKTIGYYLNNDNNTYFINEINNELLNKNSYNFNDIIKKWIYWEITTFDFLILLNIYSNRSFNDLKQYPVFPWILIQYNDFITSLDGRKETKNENTNNEDSEVDGNKNENDNYLNQIGININSNINASSIKSSSDINSKYNNNSIIEKEVNNKIKKFDIKKDMRDFSLPMGMMELTEAGEKRKKNYLDKYNLKIKSNNQIIENNENYIYRTHYSNQKYISGYLARIFPFTNINIELNGKKLINNEDLLISIDKSFYNSTSKMDDLKELCPEFFFFPEIFININYFDLKIGDKNENEIKNENLSKNKKNYLKEKEYNINDLKLLKERKLKRKNEIILNYNKNNQNQNSLLLDINDNKYYNYDSNDVIMPKWAENNPYIFVSKMKNFLESEEVGKKINQWFDLIFGYKQKGEKAIKYNNLFPPWTYDTFDIRKTKNENNKKDKSFYYKLYDKGVTPHQLLNFPFPQRLPKIVDDFSISFQKNKLKYNSFKNKKKLTSLVKRKILKIKFLENENVICVFNYFQYAIFDLLKYALIVDIKIDYSFKYYLTKEIIYKYNHLLIRDFHIISLNHPIIIYSQGRYIAHGGFYGGLILVSELDIETDDKTKNIFSSIINITEIYNKIDYSPIISLIINNSEKIIFAGTFMGSIIIYDVNWEIKNVLNDHQNLPIISIYFNDELSLWGSSCMDGYVKIYTYPVNKPVLSMKVEQSTYADFLIIISSPLPSFVIYSRKNLYFYCYSLLGKLIGKNKEEYIDIKSPVIFRDIYGNEKILYGDDTGSLNIRLLPSLELLTPFEINENSINVIGVSGNHKYCSGWSDEDEEIYIIFDPNLID